MYVSVLKSGSPFAGAFFRIENGNAELVGDGTDRIPVSIGVDPEDSDHIIVVSHAGGVSESKDGGHSWVSISDNCDGLPDKSSMSYNKVVFDPADPDTIYLLGGGDVVTTRAAALRHIGRYSQYGVPVGRRGQKLEQPQRRQSG
jgi:photosystem II stability/assembly factor-like uncharacterized protein